MCELESVLWDGDRCGGWLEPGPVFVSEKFEDEAGLGLGRELHEFGACLPARYMAFNFQSGG